MSLSSELRDNDLARPNPNVPNNNVKLSMEDEIIQGAIKAYDGLGWRKGGWSSGDQVCILESLNVSRYGQKKGSYNGIPKKVIERVHRAIWPQRSTEGMLKEQLASEVMHWNDAPTEYSLHGDGVTSAKDKKHVVSILRKALRTK